MTEDRVAPRTAAGREMLRNLWHTDYPDATKRILAIEAEAASLDRDELRKAVEALRPHDDGSVEFVAYEKPAWNAALNAVLALLSAGDKAEAPPTTAREAEPYVPDVLAREAAKRLARLR